MTTTLQRLINHPHSAVFDKSPAPVIAFRLRHNSGSTWVVSDGTLTATAGATEHEYDLRAMTVTQLAAALSADGFEVIAVSPELYPLSALVLVDGSGGQGISNGDQITGFTSLLWALLSSHAVELRQAQTQIGNALRQMVITQAEGEWLDLWGTLYSEGRRGDDDDASYAARIPEEVFRVRVNAHGIEKAILDATGEDVRIEEPWKNLFMLDKSLLSGPDKFYDGDTIGHHLIQPVARRYVDWSVILPIIERNRAAGVIVLPPLVRYIDAIYFGDPVVLGGGLSQHYRQTQYEDRALLDTGAIEDISIINHSARWRREILHISSSEKQSLGWGGLPWPGIPWTAKYYSESSHTRDYRVYFTEINYGGNWTGPRTWVTADTTWADFGPLVYAAGHLSEP